MKKTKKYIISGVVLCIVGVLLAASLWRSLGDVEASSRMSGVQKVVNDMSEDSPFVILEIVPDEESAAFGYYIKGQEPEIPSSILKVDSESGRKEAVANWLSQYEKLIGYNAADCYEEQLYMPGDMEGWFVLEFEDRYAENRTGSFQEAVDYGLEKGSYSLVEEESVSVYEYVGEGNGEYIWVDGEGEEQYVSFQKIYYKVNFTNNEWFAKYVLEIEEESYIQVKKVSPQGLEKLLDSGDLQWKDVDLLYLSAAEATNYSSANDFQNWATVVQIYGQAVNSNLPILLDDRIVTRAEDTNIRNLAYLLKAYDTTYQLGVQKDDTVMEHAKSEAEKKTEAEGVCGNIYYGTDFVSETLISTVSNMYGLAEVEAELTNENFYNEVNGTEYTSERTEDGTYRISRATIMKYIIHYGNRRAENSKETIRVLDIEPTKYSLLKESDIRNWLGETTEDSKLREIEIIQTTTAEFNGKMKDLVEEYDLIYIGSYDGPSLNGTSFVGGLNTDDGGTVYNDTGLNGLIYSDVGDIATVPADFRGLLKSDYDEFSESGEILTEDLVTRYSGNDITEMKKEELLEYVNCGYPVIISNSLYSGENAIDSGKVKDTSNMYEFMSACTGENTLDNVMKQNSTKPAQLGRYVNIPKLTLSVVYAPEAYAVQYADEEELLIESIQGLKGTEESTEETTETVLEYSFEFTDDARTISEDLYYKIQLFVDANADGQYSDYEELYDLDVRDSEANKVDVDKVKPGERYMLSKNLSSEYEGIISWKLKVAAFDGEGNELSVRSSMTGQSFVQPKGAIEIKVLQIAVSEGGLNLSQGNVGSLLSDLRSEGIYDVQITTKTVERFLQECSYTEVTAEEYYQTLADYDMLIVGFADNYADTAVEGFDDKTVDNAIKVLEMFVESERAVVFSHDTTSYTNNDSTDKANYWGYRLNRFVRKEAGMDRYGVLAGTMSETADWSGKEGFSNMLLDEYTTNELHSIAYSGGDASEPTALISQVNSGQITSYPYNVNITTSEASTSLSDMAEDILPEDLLKLLGVESGEQLINSFGIPNVGIMTPGTMTIEETHAQYYQLDLESDKDGDGKSDLIVWYSLAGNMGGTGLFPGIEAIINGSAYSAMPNDARNNYYIYSLGNVTYTAMGYSASMSNYEAKLFVNTLIAAYNLGLKNPEVNVVRNSEDKNAFIDEIYRTFDEEAGIFCETGQDIYFYVKDGNIINGNKNVKVNAYYQVNEGENHEKVGVDRYGNTIYLRSITGETVYRQEECEFEVDDHIYTVSISKDMLNAVLKTNPLMNIYIGVQVEYEHDSGRISSTEEVFTLVEIKKMSLFNLD